MIRRIAQTAAFTIMGAMFAVGLVLAAGLWVMGLMYVIDDVHPVAGFAFVIVSVGGLLGGGYGWHEGKR